jgi:WD40 repeat protein
MDGLVFRLFVSSTFADFEAERGILQRDVFPRLREQAMAGGARFVPIDLRWGISREAADQQETMEICLREVDRCHAEGQPPRLLALLGHRRGWRPLPRSVPADVWERGAPKLTPPKLDQLKRAYQPDDNARPASWVLQPVQPGADKQDEKQLLAYVTALVRAGCAKEQARSLLGAATEQELLQARLAGREGTGALIVVRTLGGLPTTISAAQEPSAKQFLELRKTADGWAPNKGAHEALAKLARELASAESSAWARLSRYKATWDENRAMVTLSERQQQTFADLAFDQLSRMMAVSLGLEPPSGVSSREQRSHAAVRRRLLTSFAGRKRELAQVRELVPPVVLNVAAAPRPVVIVSGPAGSGKSALMAKAAEQAEKDCTVIARFAGATRASASAAGLCRSINLELAGLLNIGTAHARRDDLYAVADLLAQAARPDRGFHSRKMLAVFIDGADLVGSEPGRAAASFRWLPPVMPPQVTLVLSADKDNAPALADWFHAHETIQLDPLSSADASAMLEEILRQANRSLGSGQVEALLKRQGGRWLPLPLGVAAQDAIRWPSWAVEPHLPAATTFSEVLDKRLSDLRLHGKVLVSSALGYLLAARDGLAEDELRDLLAHDEQVIDDLANRFTDHPLPMMKSATRAVPDVVLSRLLQDLSPYLAEYPIAGQALMRLTHEEFRSSALSFVSGADGRPSADWHYRLADYFRGQWHVQRVAPAIGASRQVTGKAERAGGRARNARAVTELPYQLAKAGQWDKLTEVVTDFSYLETLVSSAAQRGAEEPAETVWSAALALAELLALARQATDREPAARQAARVLQAIHEAVARERRTLARWPETCWQQLANRLLTDPDTPDVLTAALWWQSAQFPRAWLELTSAGATAALAAAYPANGAGPAEAARPSAAVTAMLSADPHGALTVMDDAGTLASWNPAGSEPPTAFRRPDGPGLAALAPLGDGRVLACDQEGALELWDVPRYRRRYGQVGSAGAGVTAMAYSPEERLLVVATEELTSGWDFDGSAAEGRLADEPRWVSRPGARWLWRLPGGRVLAVGRGRLRPAGAGQQASRAWEAACLRAADHADVWRETLPAEPRAAAVDEARDLVALGDTARRVTLRRLETGALEAGDLDVGDVPTALGFAPPGPGGDVTLLVGRADGWLARHAVPGLGDDGLLPAHDAAVRAISVHPQSARVITGGADGWVKSWDLDAGEWHELSTARHVRAGAFDATGRWALACCGGAGSYRVGAANGQWTAIAALAAPLDPVLAALPQGRGVVVTLRDGSLGWLSAHSAMLCTVPVPPAVRKVRALAAAADGTGIFAADSRGALSLIPLDDTGTAAGPVTTANTAPVTALSPLPASGVLAGDEHGRITTWTVGRAGGLSPSRPRQTSLAGITALAVAPGHGAVAAGSRDGDVVLVSDSQQVCLGRHGAEVTSMAVGLGGRVVATTSAGDDPALCVWDLEGRETERLVTRLPLPDEPVAVAFLPNRPELAVLGRHGRLRNLRLHLGGAIHGTE